MQYVKTALGKRFEEVVPARNRRILEETIYAEFDSFFASVRTADARLYRQPYSYGHACGTRLLLGTTGFVTGLCGNASDIRLFTVLLLRDLRQVVRSCGLDVTTEPEIRYLMMLLQASLSPEGTSAVCRSSDTKTQIHAACHALADAMAASKYLQSRWFIGAIGGLQNGPLYQKIIRFVRKYYRQRR